MTLEDCQMIYDHIATQIDKIERRMEEERVFDSGAIQALGNYCLAQYPRFKGRFGNVGGKVLQLHEDANSSLTLVDTAPLRRGVMWIEAAIAIHRYGAV